MGSASIRNVAGNVKILPKVWTRKTTERCAIENQGLTQGVFVVGTFDFLTTEDSTGNK